MDLLPAIDLMDGQVVRLAEGKRDAVTVYEQDPARLVRRFAGRVDAMAVADPTTFAA